jgi:hypothetical protein
VSAEDNYCSVYQEIIEKYLKKPRAQISWQLIYRKVLQKPFKRCVFEKNCARDIGGGAAIH